MNEEEATHHTDSSEDGSVIGLILLVILAIWGYIYQDNKLSKPWWKGTEYQEVCDWQGIKCYELPVTISDDNQMVNVTFPNGGRVYGYVACHKRYGGGRFCEFSDQERNQWDILPINQ